MAARRRTPPTLLAAVAVLLLCQSAGLGAGLMVTPLNHTVRLRPGQQESFQFAISNGGDQSAVVEVRLMDVEEDIRGLPQLSPPGTTGRSCAGWLRTTEGTRSIPPGGTYTIGVTCGIPGNAAGSYHAAVVVRFVGSSIPRPGASTAGVVPQVVLPIHVVAAGTEKRAVELAACGLTRAERTIRAVTEEHAQRLRGKWALLPTVRNTGNCLVRVRGDVVVTTERGTLVGRYTIGAGGGEEQAILPAAAVRFPILLDSTLPESEYRARMNLVYEGARGLSVPMQLYPRRGADSESGEVVLGETSRTGLQTYAQPSLLVSTVPPGGVRTERITVTNLEDVPVSVTARVLPCTIDTDGTPVPQSDTAAGVPWLTLGSPGFRLGPKQSRSVVVRVRQDALGQSDPWAMVQFSVVGATPGSDAATGTTAHTVVLMQGAESASPPTLALESVSITRGADGPCVSASVRSDSALAATFTDCTLQLMPSGAGPVTKPQTLGGGEAVLLLPAKLRRLDFPLPAGITSGDYLCTLTFTARQGGASVGPVRLEFTLSLGDPTGGASAAAASGTSE